MGGMTRSRSLEDASIARMPPQNAVLSVRAERMSQSKTRRKWRLWVQGVMALAVRHIVSWRHGLISILVLGPAVQCLLPRFG
ncbi:hypothetical protein BDZ89DRAFT_74511 [Hymenopellis radicata]|nr:hypothetical protein BDZ89DRAFT_74511 [Hymenopellis radicata]